MRKLIFLILLAPLIFCDYGCKDNSTEPDDNDTSSVVDRKPNLYIYPDRTLSLSVEILFPKGGEILEAIPDYQNLWEVTVEPSGRINESYDYLFYECSIPDFTQKEFGWVIAKENLAEFFNNNLSISGFSQKEIDDFIDYWIPILTDYEYYEIYPQYKSILNEVIEIHFSKEPANFYRLHYLLIGRNDNKIQLPTPNIETASRENYFAVEWGVILK